MDTVYDVILIGGGAAATSAVLTLKNRGKSAAVITNRSETSSLFKAERITNYPGLPPMDGAEMTALFRRQIEEAGAAVITGRALSVMPMGDSFGVAVEVISIRRARLSLPPALRARSSIPARGSSSGAA